ncbi:MAG: GTPase ObgE [Tenericutes bacterium]|nr:GTPase ObgE [Mycoplasmatota bacterium]
MFIDEVTLKLVAGKGGDGCTSFLREKYVELGGPDGGNGGRGGNIIFKADKGLRTLIDLRYKKVIKGNNGSPGKGRNQTGATAQDTIITVPIGTTVKDIDNNLILCDLTVDKQESIIASGGRGGKGNAAFKSNKNKAPYTSEYGEPGEERNIICELKLLADVGLVGFPSVGKSSLVSVISAAKPKVAEYHFTTLVPNLGVVKAGEYSYVVADLPGLIEGSSKGVGLGDKFLKHATRCKIVCHILDMAQVDNRDVIEDYNTIRKEIKEYSENLYNKFEVIVANKMDVEISKENLKRFKKEFPNKEIIEVSAATSYGTKELVFKLKEILMSIPDENVYKEEEFEDYVLYEFKHEKPYKIERIGDKWVVSGEKLEKLLKMTRFNSDESALRFARKLKYLGVDNELKELGAKHGDTVSILDQEFEYEERIY